MTFLKKHKYWVCFGLLFALCWLFPYTGDDWAWGSQIGLDRLNNWFYNYSGRYVGNLIVLALTRSNLLKALAMSGCLTGILYCAERLAPKNQTFPLTVILLLLLPRVVMRQAIVWTAGFANYTTSVFLTLLYVVSFYWILEKKDTENMAKAKQRPLMAVGMLLLGAVNTLIVEHVTLYNLAVSVIVVVFILCKYRRVLIQYVAYMLGAVAGTVYMFSNPVYSSVATGADDYRTMATGLRELLQRAEENYYGVIYKEFYMNNIVMNLVILALCLLVFFGLRARMSRLSKGFSLVSLGVSVLYAVWSVFSVYMINGSEKSGQIIQLEGIFTAVSGFLLIGFLLLVGFYQGNFWKMLFLCASVLLVTAPLLVVTPIGSRCFFVSYVFFALVAAELAAMLPRQTLDALETLKIKPVASAAIAGLLAVYFIVFGAIYAVDAQRIAHVRREVALGKTQIEVQKHPFREYLWCSDPTGDVWSTRYKLFHDLPEELEFVMVEPFTAE